MKDAFSVDPTKDLPDERKLKVDETNDFVAKRQDADPYGFWWISRERGQVPVELSGAYTSIDLANAAVTQYLSKIKK